MESELWILFIIFITLLAASIIFSLLRKWNHGKDYHSVFQRVNTWWGMFVIFSLATLFNPIVSLISLGILSFFALKEYFSMIKTRKPDRRLFLWAYLTIPVQFYWIYTDWYGMFIVFIPIYVFLFLPIPRLFKRGTIGFVRSVSSTQWGLMLMVFGLSHLAYYQMATPEYGAGLVLYLVLITQIGDLINHIVSMYFAKRKVVPTANPYLTWDGFIVSLFVTMIVSIFIYPHLTPFSLQFAIVSAGVICFSGFIGSLAVSVLKRDLLLGDTQRVAKMKKSYLSRVDSLTYASPVFFHFLRYFFDFL